METPIITIDFRNFILGESTDERAPNRGFSKQSNSINLYKEKGTLYFQEAATDRSTNLEGDVIATTNDPDFLGNDNYIVDDEGKFYTLDGNTLTKRQTDAVKTYARGTTDLLKYQGAVYATSQTDVAYLTGGDLTAIDHDWWTTTRGHSALQSSYRHPMEIVEDTLYIADKNEIHTWDGTTSVQAAMALPTGVNITTLRKHTDGRHLIAFCGVTANYSHTLSGGGVIYLIDTVNLEFIREIAIDTQVEGSKNVSGVIYTTYGDKLGYFNGDGITWLRDLTAGSTTYSHEIGNAEDILIIRDGIDVLAYGDLGQGKVFWRAYRTSAPTYSSVTAVGYKGSNKILVGFVEAGSGEKLHEVNIRNAGVVGGFYSNHYQLGGHVAIRRIEIDHTETANPATNGFALTLYDGVGNQLYTAAPSYVNQTIQQTRLDVDAFARDVQLYLYPSNGAMGFRQIRIYGESIE